MRSILTLDDDETFNDLVTEKMNGGLFHVQTTNNAKDFFYQLKTRKWDVCFVDINIAEGAGAGVHVIDCMRRKMFSSVPVIAMSRNNERKIIDGVMMAGASDFVSKPFDLEMILSKIYYLVDFDLGSVPVPILPTRSLSQINRSSVLSFSLQLTSVWEIGFCCQSNSLINKDAEITFYGETIESIFGLKEFTAKVFGSERKKDGSYEVKFLFSSEHRAIVNYLKTWIHKKKSIAV